MGRTIGWAAASAVVATAALTGCSQTAAEEPPSSSQPVLDCVLALTAMDDYSIALGDLATSIQAGDAMSAVAAADAMSYSLDQLESALPGIPAAGQDFLAASREVTLQVKQSAADSPQLTGLLAELTTAFADPAFADGGGAIDEYVVQMCPGASPSPESS
ncbi:MAG: hypothetical protein ACO20A_04475 [Candidatus Nanopelagicales bacterium]